MPALLQHHRVKHFVSCTTNCSRVSYRRHSRPSPPDTPPDGTQAGRPDANLGRIPPPVKAEIHPKFKLTITDLYPPRGLFTLSPPEDDSHSTERGSRGGRRGRRKRHTPGTKPSLKHPEHSPITFTPWPTRPASTCQPTARSPHRQAMPSAPPSMPPRRRLPATATRPSL